MSCLNSHDPITIRIFTTDGVFHTLYANEHGGMRRDGVLVKVKQRRKRHEDGEYATTSTSPNNSAVCRTD